jgi:hypothetical protein
MKKIFYFLLLISFQISAQTNYYVKNGGDDDASGTSDATAWATLSKIELEQSNFTAGDTIFFNCGDIWRGDETTTSNWGEMLDFNSSGESGNHITFASYGTGEKPKIYGSIAESNFSSHQTLSNVYVCDGLVDHNPYELPVYGDYHGSIFFQAEDSVIWGDAYQTLANLDQNYEYAWQNDSLYFYYNGTIADIDSIEIVQKARGFQIDGNYITIDGIEFRYFERKCIGTSQYPERTRRGLEVRNCEFAYTSVREGSVGYGMNVYHSDMVIEDNEFHDNGRRNLSINLVDQSTNCLVENVIIQRNNFYSGWHTTGLDLAVQGGNDTLRNITFRQNRVYENPSINKSGYNVTLNFIEANGNAIIDSFMFYNNIIMNAYRPALQLTNVDNAYVIYNTFSGHPYDLAGSYGIIYQDGTGSSTIVNNIFYNYAVNSLYTSIRFNSTSTTLNEGDYNLFYSAYDGNYLYQNYNGTSYRQSEWSSLQSTGVETNSLAPPQNPLFISQYSNVNISENSPAISNAKVIDWITTDYNGNTRSSSTPTIGAYEYTGETPVDPPVTQSGRGKSGKYGSKLMMYNGHIITINQP